MTICGIRVQKRVWQALLTIPFGETWSYGQLAQRIGNAKASRAVGAANGKNPLSIVVPCHRVIGTSGKLTGFAGGLEVKARLLALESKSGQRKEMPSSWPSFRDSVIKKSLPACALHWVRLRHAYVGLCRRCGSSCKESQAFDLYSADCHKGLCGHVRQNLSPGYAIPNRWLSWTTLAIERSAPFAKRR